MTHFSSYAQNFQGVMLSLAPKGIEKGLYVDVAQKGSEITLVAKAFYDCGWRGINIVPTEVFFRHLQEAHHDDN